jgi:nitrite reductase/ring-hydroxylating ferredoxin subunit
MAQSTKVADLKALPPGKSACVEFDGETVALFNVGGTVYAIANTCTHRGGPLSEGEVEGTTVTCPWHGAHFDLKTGAAVGPPATQSVKRYQVTVKGYDILLSVP